MEKSNLNLAGFGNNRLVMFGNKLEENTTSKALKATLQADLKEFSGGGVLYLAKKISNKKQTIIKKQRIVIIFASLGIMLTKRNRIFKEK